MAVLNTLANNPIFNEKLGDTNFIQGKNRELWIAPLNYLQNVPNTFTLTMTTDIAIDDEAVTLSTGAGLTLQLYAKQVIYKPGDDVLLVVAEDTLVTSAGVSVPILPSEGATVIATNTVMPIVYPMVPIMSISDGGLPSVAGQEATANNKGQSLFNAKAKTTADSSLTFSGAVVRNDPGLAIADALSYNNQYAYFESRLAAFDNRGRGWKTQKFRGQVLNLDPSSTRADFEQVSVTISISGCPEDYVVLGTP